MSIEILHYGRMHWPVDWPDLYGREAPLLVEIGFGGGHYLVHWARSRPECNLLGLEISLQSLYRGAKKLASAGLSNTRIIQGDSSKALWLLCQPHCIDEVAINFPDPWPKSSHQHRRLINEKFLHLLGTRMQPGGLLDIATDHEEYAHQIAQSLQRSPYFDSRLDRPYKRDAGARRTTKYEQIAISEGRDCHYFLWRRNDQPAANEFPIPEETKVPHVVMSHPLNLDQIGKKFEPFQVDSGSTHIRYLDIYRSERNALQLVEIYVSEEPYHQRVCLAIRRRKAGDIVVSLHELGFPRPTAGIHQAVHHLVQWLLTLHPEVHVLSNTLNMDSVAGS
jgi:tRNA (guanine-N7-)-methyltransferase